jgi:hypothetical protein
MSRRGKMALVGAVIGVVAALYFSGRMDPLLYNVGLNFHPCLKNGYGAVFCGQNAKNYCDELDSTGVNDLNSNSASVCQSVGDTGAGSTGNTGNGTVPEFDPATGEPCAEEVTPSIGCGG